MHNNGTQQFCFGRNRKQTFYVTGETIGGEILLSEVLASLAEGYPWGSGAFPVPCRLQQGLSAPVSEPGPVVPAAELG